MKKKFNEYFKNYIFPILLLIIGAYIELAENFQSITNFFKESSSKFLKFFDISFYLWEIILYLIVFIVIKLIYNKIFNSQSKETKRKLNAIKKSPDFINISVDNRHKFKLKYKATVENEDYVISNIKAYCNNCTDDVILMRNTYFQDYECNCGTKLAWKTVQDVKSRIITDIEKNELIPTTK